MPAADEIMPMAEPRGSMSLGEHAVDEVAVADEVDPLDARCAVGDARAREQRVTGPPHSSTAASIDALSDEVELIALTPARLTVGAVHHDDLGAGVLHELGDRGAHAGGAADDERHACRCT